MTNTISKDGGEEARVAAVAAVNLVKQVLDDAYVIANIVRETGQPWRYLSLIKSLHYGKFLEMENRHIFLDSKIDEESIEELIIADTMTTSKNYSDKNKHAKENNEELIGQGDTSIELDDNTERDSKSPTILINNLFDMSDVERELDKVQIEDNTDVGALIMKSCFDDALNIANKENVEVKEEVKDKSSSSSASFSTYSFLAEEVVDDVGIDEANTSNKIMLDENNYDNVLPCSSKSKITEQKIAADKTKSVFCEKAFLSLNRDDEQDSDQDEQDIKQENITAFQDIQLMPPSGSGDNLKKTKEKNKEIISNDIPSSTGRHRKTTLARRCRIHGVRMLACLRGWWMRRNGWMSKRQVYHAPKINSPCPASPKSRKRAMSLLNQKQVGEAPEHCVVWKLNTVNESLVNSKRWKDEFNAEIIDELL